MPDAIDPAGPSPLPASSRGHTVVSIEGGSPQGYSQAQPWENNAFEPDGTLRPAYADRMRRIIDSADALGMVVMLGCFYFGQDQRLTDEAAVIKAVDQVTAWVLDHGWRHVVIEVNNECDIHYDHAILQPARRGFPDAAGTIWSAALRAALEYERRRKSVESSNSYRAREAKAPRSGALQRAAAHSKSQQGLAERAALRRRSPFPISCASCVSWLKESLAGSTVPALPVWCGSAGWGSGGDGFVDVVELECAGLRGSSLGPVCHAARGGGAGAGFYI